jgi:predicted DNA-binding transcriptional regulator
METLTRKPAVVSKESVEKVLSIITTKKVSMSDITTEGKMSETTVRAAIKELADKINVEIVNKKNFYSIKESKKAALTQREVLKDFIITVVSTPAPKKALKKEVKEIIISDEIAEDNIKKYKPKNDDMILINYRIS